jgi:hypothetical protein
MRLLLGDHVGLDVAECGIRFVFDAVVKGLDDVLLEVRRAREGISSRASWTESQNPDREKERIKPLIFGPPSVR